MKNAVNLLGAVMIVVSGFLLGLSGVRRLTKRERELLELQKLMQRLITGIQFSARPLPEFILENRDLSVCKNAAQEEGMENDPHGALEKVSASLFPEQKDFQLCRGFLTGLGTSDIEGQIEHITLYSALLEENLREARTEREQKGRLYLALGLFGGITICLILL